MLKKINVSFPERLRNLKKLIPTLHFSEVVSGFKKFIAELDKDVIDMLSSFFLFLASIAICGLFVIFYSVFGGLL